MKVAPETQIDPALLARFQAAQEVAATARIIRCEKAGERREADSTRCERAKLRARGRWTRDHR